MRGEPRLPCPANDLLHDDHCGRHEGGKAHHLGMDVTYDLNDALRGHVFPKSMTVKP